MSFDMDMAAAKLIELSDGHKINNLHNGLEEEKREKKSFQVLFVPNLLHRA